MKTAKDHPPSLKRGNVIYCEDRFTILTSKDGLPSAEALSPAPMMDESSRQRRIEQARVDAALSGWWITSERRIRNPVFDNRGEATTTKYRMRICKTDDEANVLAAKIREFMESK